MNWESLAAPVGIGTALLTGKPPQAQTTAAPGASQQSNQLIQGAGPVPQNAALQNPGAMASIIQALLGGKAPGQVPSSMGALSQPPPSVGAPPI